jgi:hypothetical protein
VKFLLSIYVCITILLTAASEPRPTKRRAEVDANGVRRWRLNELVDITPDTSGFIMEDTPVKTAPIPSTSRALSEEADQGVTNNAPNFAENAVPCIALDSDEEEIDWDARPLSERLGMNL